MLILLEKPVCHPHDYGNVSPTRNLTTKVLGEILKAHDNA